MQVDNHGYQWMTLDTSGYQWKMVEVLSFYAFPFFSGGKVL